MLSFAPIPIAQAAMAATVQARLPDGSSARTAA
jgi:hypothetical protein